jgi:Sulfotransferase family
MTGRLPPISSRDSARPDRADMRGNRGPIIVLGDSFFGAMTMQRLLSRDTALACTSGIGMLPLCEQAAISWLHVEHRDEPLSQLAIASIRAMTDSLIITVLSGTGNKRWCEVASAHPRGAEVFLQLYPGAKFICMHRSCLDVIAAAVRTNPWGLADSIFRSFAIGYPGNSVAAVAAYWIARSEAILDFERAHPAASHRVRFEDLVGSPARVRDEISSFLELSQEDSWAGPCVVGDAFGESGEDEDAASGRVPPDMVPPQLRTRLDELLQVIGYPPIPAPGPLLS